MSRNFLDWCDRHNADPGTSVEAYIRQDPGMIDEDY